jgi:hypothetical protein
MSTLVVKVLRGRQFYSYEELYKVNSWLELSVEGYLFAV